MYVCRVCVETMIGLVSLLRLLQLERLFPDPSCPPPKKKIASVPEFLLPFTPISKRQNPTRPVTWHCALTQVFHCACPHTGLSNKKAVLSQGTTAQCSALKLAPSGNAVNRKNTKTIGKHREVLEKPLYKSVKV